MSDNAPASLDQYTGVWVFGEQIDGVIQGVVHELIGKGRELADKRGAILKSPVSQSLR